MSFWHWILRRRQGDRELDEELRFHIAEETRLRQERGQDRAGAERSARRDFGNLALAREVTRGMWGWSAVERAAQDLRFALRMMAKNPAFTCLALVALALGIGATTAMFTVVNSVLLRPLPFRDPGRLVVVWERPPDADRNNVVQTQNFLDWRKRNRSFDDIAALFEIPMNLEGEGEPVQVPGMLVTAGFFEILGTRPLLGRTIRPEDDVRGAPGVVLLDYGLWQRRFGGRADVLGRKIVIQGGPHEVIGVMPPGFNFPTQARADLYRPMQIDPAAAPRDGRNYSTVARLRPNVSLRDAQADIRAIAAQTAQERPEMNAKWSANVVPLMDETVKNSRQTLLMLFGSVTLVLLIACANVSNLLLMRASARRREMTLRVALGAGRWRLVHQLLTESFVLAVTGGLLGLLLAWWGVPAILGMLPAGFPLPRMGEIAVNSRVLIFAMAVSLGCGVFFGLLPALQVDRSRMSEGLRQGGRYGSAGNQRLRGLLVVAEVGLAMLLVIGAGLMLRSFLLLHATNSGFQPERLLTFRMLVVPQQFSSFEELLARRAAMVRDMLDRIRTLPGVTAASSVHLLPLTGMQSGSWFSRADRPEPPPGSQEGGDVSIISDDYFRTMGARLLAGREFNARDRMGAPPVAIINQAAARHFFPDENPIGKRLRVWWPPDQGPAEIVGVVADVRNRGLDRNADPCLFLPQGQKPSGFVALVVRTSGNPLAAIAAVKQQIRAAAPHQGTQQIETMESVMGASIARPRLEAAILVIFGLVALTLACVGIYAVISYSVEQRTRELGIRLALGAAPIGVLLQVLHEGMTLAGAGIAAGFAAALVLTRYLASLLYSVRPTDALVYASVSAALALAAMAGCYVPARRATRVDPAVVLREE